MAQTVSKAISLTDTTDGHKINYASFGFTTYESFKYFRIHSVSTGTLSIKFGANDDWIDIDSAEYPVIFNDSIRFNEIYLKPSTALTVNIVAFLV
jgi:hypothetical protein